MILILLTLGSWISLQSNATKNIQVDVSGNGLENTRIEFTIPGFYLDTVTINGNSYSMVNMPGVNSYLKEGYPDLPRVAKSVIIPDDREMKLRIVREDVERVKFPPVVPSKGNLLRNVSPSSVPYTFSDFYYSTGVFPEEAASLSEPFIMRDFRGITVYVNPVRYDAGTGEIIILRELIVEIFSEGFSLSNVKARSMKKSFSLSFENVYKDFFINYSEGKSRYDMLEEDGGRMIILCADQYVSEMDSFLIWKRRKGISTDLYSLSEVGSDTASIGNFIKEQYDSLGVTFCLLVGDGDELPPPVGTVGRAFGEDSDPVYAYTDGDDYYPDLFIGRFSSDGGEADNIRNQVMRSIKYERNPEEGGDWYSKGLMVASDESDDYDSIMDKDRCEWLKDTLLYNISPYFTYTSIDSSYDPWGSSSVISSAINSGVSIINYIGHGYVSGWQSGGGFTISNIENLTNYWMLPHVISVGCRVGDFRDRNCFSESALTAGTVEDPTGFIVTLGPTIDQTWIPPCIGQEGAVNLLAHYKANTAGGIYFNGLCYMIEQCGGDTSNDGVEIAQTWHIFGDPSIQLRTDVPRKLKVNKVLANFLDSLVCEVKVYEEDSVTPVENAMVSFCSKENSLIASGYTNSAGNYKFTFDSSNFMRDEYVYLTVTDFNYKPYLDSTTLMSIVFSPDSVEVNVPTEVEILTSSGLEVVIDGFGFWACDTTDDSGRAIINISAPYGGELQISFFDTAEARLFYKKTLPVFGALDLTAPDIQASCDEIGVSGGLMPGFSGRILGSADSLSFSMFIRGAGIDTSFFAPDGFLEKDLIFEEPGEVEVTLGKSGYNVYQKVFPVINYRGWLSGYVISGADSVNEITLRIYGAGSDTGSVTPVAVMTSDDNGFYELEDSLLCGYYDVYMAGVGYQSELYPVTVKNSSSNLDFNISPESYAIDLSTLINGNYLEVKYSLPQETNVEFIVFDALGRKITSESELKNSGNFTQVIDMQDFSTGIYFFVMKAGNRVFPPEKFILIR
ncbi:hypothetical protein JW879_04665 [candidate division WOR-3 bacterium]|nr:hypothetical protein [candidate division WOR-3 bacterium]